MEFLYEYLIFLAKVVTFVMAFGITMLIAVAIASKGKSIDKDKPKLDILKLNERYEDLKKQLERKTLSKKEFKNLYKKKEKEKKKQKDDERNKLFLINFVGDMRASTVDQLSEQVTAILQTATPDDEVVINIESPGGIVHAYGLAASQLARIRDRNIPLTACVDKVAASGGYLMATVANQILAAPFAIVGSIGVIGQVPNFNRLLKKNYIDYEEHTAGKYKRSLSHFGEVTEEGREKFRETLAEVHILFKDHISKYRPEVNIEEVANGDYWHGETAKKLQLVDRIITSDDYLLGKVEKADIYLISSKDKKNMIEKITHSAQLLIDNLNPTIK